MHAVFVSGRLVSRFRLPTFVVLIGVLAWLAESLAVSGEPADHRLKALRELTHCGIQIGDDSAPIGDQLGEDPALAASIALGAAPIRRGLCLASCPGLLFDMDDDDLAPLDRVRDVEQLDLADKNVTDATLPRIARLTTLRVLRLAGTRISDAGLAHLARLDALRSLDLSDTEITDEGLARLPALPRLETLRLTGTRITDASLKGLARLPSLRHLDLSRTGVTDAGLSQARKLRGLRLLDLGDTDVDGSGLACLDALPELTQLFLDGTRISDGTLRLIAAAAKLRSLDVSRTAIDGRGLGHLRALRSLIDLRLSDTRIDDRALEELSTFGGLKILDLSKTAVGDAGLPFVGRLAALEYLDLSSTRVARSPVTLVKSLPKLKRLWLESTPVDEPAAPLFSAAKRLDMVSLGRSEIPRVEPGERRILSTRKCRRARCDVEPAWCMLGGDWGARLEIMRPDSPGVELDMRSSHRQEVFRLPLREIVAVQALARKLFPKPVTPLAGWVKAGRIDGRDFAPFRPLTLKSDRSLCLYDYGGRYARMAWSVPAGRAEPVPDLVGTGRGMLGASGRLPYPGVDAERLLAAVCGDDSPRSYLWASLLNHEWEQITRPPLALTDWQENVLVQRNPFESESLLRWQWIRWMRLVPRRWEPRVEMAEKSVVVTFYSLHQYDGGPVILAHRDTYSRGDYRCRSEITEIGWSGREFEADERYR